MGTLDLKKLLLGTSLLIGASTFAMAPTAYAQDADTGVTQIEEADEEEADEEDADFVVTGSRVKRSTFNSISPLQIITTDASKDVGLIDPTAILQQSEAASGQQIDTSFQGFVLDNGPNSTTLNLRGLGSDRTLLLINGRRFAPAGVEGAPTQPSINLLPGSLIERYDLLLDGASSVYGSDAVAGVGNAILRQDFDGFEFFASGDYNVEGGGNDYTLSGAWGKNTDRAFFGIGAEYDKTDPVTFGDRDFLAGCETHYEITEDGEIRTFDVRTNLQNLADTQGLIGAKSSPCVSGAGGFTQRIFDQGNFFFPGDPAFGSLYYTPGAGNFGSLLSDWSDTGLFAIPLDQDGDGVEDLYFPDFSPGSRDLNQNLIADQELISVMGYGQYTFEGDANITPYFETLYTQLDASSNSGVGVLFPDIPATNPFNLCNPDADGGVDCGLAEDAVLASPEYLAAFQSYYDGGGGSADCFGFSGPACTPALFGLFNGPIGAVPISPQVSIAGDRNLNDVELSQFRFVGGVKGDMPWLNNASLNDWSFDASVVYSVSDGTSSRRGIRDDRLALALGWDPTTDRIDSSGAFNVLGSDGVPDRGTDAAADPLLVRDADGNILGNLNGGLTVLPGGACDVANVANPELLADDAAAGCVPVNMLAPSLLSSIYGTFATQAEADYLFDTRDFDTEYTQTVFNAFATGELLQLPAGAVSAVVGYEYREDEIVSTPDEVASRGLFFGFFTDKGAEGSIAKNEFFGELDIPLLANHPIATELTANLSARYTDDEFYGDDTTYSAKLGYRPIDPLLLKASFGTSFRAPNLRENFLLGQSGFRTLFDPCAVPEEALDINGNYIADNDPREVFVIENCLRENRDPFSIGIINGRANQFASTEFTSIGALVADPQQILEPETSESLTVGFSFEQPFTDAFDLNIGVNYYDIEVENSIIEAGAFVVNACFLNQNAERSVFCDRMSYNGQTGLLSDIEAGFINQDKDTVIGLDYNVQYDQELTMFGRPVDLGVNLRANQLKERGSVFVDAQGNDLSEDFTGEFGFPEWTGTGTVTLEFDKYRATWQTRYIGDVEQDPTGIDEFDDALGSQGTGFFGDTCGGPAEGDVLCRDVGFADEWTESAVSFGYIGDTMELRAGVTNVFDNKPPKVDGNEVFSISNTPIGNGYDLDGREYFVSFQKRFN